MYFGSGESQPVGTGDGQEGSSALPDHPPLRSAEHPDGEFQEGDQALPAIPTHFF